jgi:hypothetical protein
MTRKNWMLIILAIFLAGLSLYLNRDWFAKENIQIYHRSRPLTGMFRRRRPVEPGSVNPLMFGFSQKLKLTSVRVVPVAALATNKLAPALWHLVSDSNSVPTKDIMYGAPIQGMHPYYKGAVAQPLEPDVQYRLFIETPSYKGEHDFSALALGH